MDVNTYFHVGYDDVYQDEVTGIVHNDEPVFPSDKLGNYFYLRLPNNIGFDYSGYFSLDECSNTPGKKYDLILVACVKDADPEGLLDNLLSTLSTFQKMISLTSATIQGNVVINSELGFMSRENREAALKRKPDNMAIVSISFSYTEETLITKNSCIELPCPTC